MSCQEIQESSQFPHFQSEPKAGLTDTPLSSHFKPLAEWAMFSVTSHLSSAIISAPTAGKPSSFPSTGALLQCFLDKVALEVCGSPSPLSSHPCTYSCFHVHQANSPPPCPVTIQMQSLICCLKGFQMVQQMEKTLNLSPACWIGAMHHICRSNKKWGRKKHVLIFLLRGLWGPTGQRKYCVSPENNCIKAAWRFQRTG